MCIVMAAPGWNHGQMVSVCKGKYLLPSVDRLSLG
jgi:hypothetical protein